MAIKFKPMLLANDEAGASIIWEERIEHPGDWLASIKDDGVRMELFGDGSVLGRSLKPVPSIHVQRMAKEFNKSFKFNGVVEAELYAEGMTLPEIVHFSRAVDVEDPKYKKKWDALWKKTNQGTTSYKKTVKGEQIDAVWDFPGRTPEWLCTWQPSLYFQVFGCFPYEQPHLTMEERYNLIKPIADVKGCWKLVNQWTEDTVESIKLSFSGTQDNEREGLVLMHKGGGYKRGRVTLLEKIGYKFKDFNIEFTCTILQVVEMTQAIAGAPKTTNELGRSVTSKLAEHREPTGMAKGFKVLLADGQDMIVSLNGYNHQDRRNLWLYREKFPGKVITCTGGKPVKVGGKPRSAHYTKGYVAKSKV